MDTLTDRRDDANLRMSAALLRLRIVEDKAVMMLPLRTGVELAEAIQGVVDLIRKGAAP